MTNKNKQPFVADISDLVVTRVDLEQLSGGGYYACGFNSNQQILAITGRVGAGDDDHSFQTARRIVACLRACVNIDTDVLEVFVEGMHGRKRNADLKDVADKDASVLSAASKAIAITAAYDAISKASASSRQT